jgi:hypothetical protein
MIEVAIMESAMAPMITASILATTHGLKPRLSSMMIGFEFLFLLSHYFLVFCFEFYLSSLSYLLYLVNSFQNRKIVSNPVLAQNGLLYSILHCICSSA